MSVPPVSYAVDEARRLVETTVRDGFTYADIAACFALLRADPRIQPDFNRLAVYEVSAARLSAAQIRDMVDAARRVPHGDTTRVAIVVHDDASYGMMRMYEIQGELQGTSARVFRDREPAYEWLAGGA